MTELIKVMKDDKVQELSKKQIMFHPLWVKDRNEAGFNFRKAISFVTCQILMQKINRSHRNLLRQYATLLHSPMLVK